MEATHRSKATRRFGPALRGKRVVCLRIPNRYDYMDSAFVELLRERVACALPQLRSGQ